MKKKLIYMFLFVATMSFLTPFRVDALTVEDYMKQGIYNNVYILEKTDNVDMDSWMEDYNKEQDCSGILGDPKDEDSVAWLLQLALNYIKIVGPMLVIILSSVDFIQVIVKGDDDSMKKAGKKLGYRLILAASLFFIPVFVSTLLNLFGITADPTCNLK